MYYDMTQGKLGGQGDIYNTQQTGAEPGEIDWSDIVQGSNTSSTGYSKSKQYSGLPSWFNFKEGPWSIAELWKNAQKNGMLAWQKADRGGEINPVTAALIEQQRKLMPQQYASEMSDYYNRQINPMMNSLSSRGVLNSSVTGDALAKALRTQAAKQSDQVTQANTWASNEMLKNLGANQQLNMEKWKTIFNFYPQLLAAIRESLGESSSEWSSESESWGDLPI